jgi:membrane-bound lytic murein transglycosylase MltF
LFVLQTFALDTAESQTIKVNTLKQITFHKMDYNFEQFYCLDEIVWKESRWNPKAKNPKSSAYGLFQILKSKEKDPIKQIDNGLKYINARYNGCACTALAHHKAKGWY